MRKNLFMIIGIILVFGLFLQCGLSAQAFACFGFEKEGESRKVEGFRESKELQNFKYVDMADCSVLLALPRIFGQFCVSSEDILKDTSLALSKPFNHSPPLFV